MDIKKYEQLINLVINENQEQASELFHEIIIEKSREIFESIMEDDMSGSQVGDLLDEIDADESGVMEDDEEDFNDFNDFGDEEDEIEFSDEDMIDSEDAESAEVEDAVIRIEDKLDQLMAEFEEIMGGEGADDMDDTDLDAGEDFEGEEEGFEDFDDEEESSEEMMEAVQLQKVSVTHGDDGAQKKSPVAANAGKAGMDSKPVSFAGGDEKGRSAPGTKDLPGAGKFKNSPGHKSQDLNAAPKPKHGDDGSNTKSPVAESRRAVRRRIR